jgi:transposase
LTKARILLLTDYSTDAHHTNKEIVQTLLVSEPTIIRVRRRCVDGGLEFALYDKPRPGKPPKITGEIEAQITLLACSDPPAGHTRWTLRLLADTVVELGLLDSITHVAISKRLKKTL